MPMFKVVGPDGTPYNIEAASPEEAGAAFEEQFAPPPPAPEPQPEPTPAAAEPPDEVMDLFHAGMAFVQGQ